MFESCFGDFGGKSFGGNVVECVQKFFDVGVNGVDNGGMVYSFFLSVFNVLESVLGGIVCVIKWGIC